MPAKKTFYELLEVDPRARPEVIHAAWRAIVKVVHPKSLNSDGAVAQAINEAYTTLSDPKLRRKYDLELSQGDPKQIGEYRLLEMIAEGGFGRTYKGEHMLTGEPVCIKHCSRLAAEFDDVLIDEAKAMWDLRHFSIPVVRDLIRIKGGRLALVMSYIPGPTLAKLVDQHGPLDPEHVAWITERVLNALMYMHYHGVIHGDIKPQNIIIQPESHTVVIVDFGLSLVKPTRDVTSKGFTEYFAAPEQIRGGRVLPESDLYSLGMTMVYALSGDLDRVAAKEVPTDVPDPLCKFIQRLIVRDMTARPNWKKENLCTTIQQVRTESFGRTNSGMKPLPV